MAAHRQSRPAAGAKNECWSMDLISDALFDGRCIRALIAVENFSRERPGDRNRKSDQL
jgi:putative transposase